MPIEKTMPGGVRTEPNPRDGAITGTISRAARHPEQTQYVTVAGREIENLVTGRRGPENLADARIRLETIEDPILLEKEIIRVTGAEALLDGSLRSDAYFHMRRFTLIDDELCEVAPSGRARSARHTLTGFALPPHQDAIVEQITNNNELKPIKKENKDG